MDPGDKHRDAAVGGFLMRMLIRPAARRNAPDRLKQPIA
jgi:hypothetical protein